MANLTIRRDEGSIFPRFFSRGFDPLDWMRDIITRDPFREMIPALPQAEAVSYVPAFEVKETKDGYQFRADVPGVKESDLEITLTGQRLSVAGKREEEKQEKNDTYFTYERSYGSFCRSFTLPEGVDDEHVRAELKDGVLTIAMSKKPELKAKKIEVKADKAKA
jgi:HSP20 family protein